jgi:hypothetical protein
MNAPPHGRLGGAMNTPTELEPADTKARRQKNRGAPFDEHHLSLFIQQQIATAVGKKHLTS